MQAAKLPKKLVLTKSQADDVLRLFDEALTDVTNSHAVAGSVTKGTAS